VGSEAGGVQAAGGQAGEPQAQLASSHGYLDMGVHPDVQTLAVPIAYTIYMVYAARYICLVRV